MEKLFKFSTTVRMLVSLKSRTIGTTLALMLATSAACLAQVSTSTKPVKETTEIKNPGINTQIKIADKKPGTTPKVLEKDPALKYLPATTTPGKDLMVVIDKIVDNSTSSENKYVIHFTLINSGSEDIDITGVVMQGKFSTGETGGSMAFSKGILKSRTWVHGTMGTSSYYLYNNAGSQKYILTADATNKIAETNEKNNMSEDTVVGHIPPPPVSDPALKPDLIISGITVVATNDVLHVDYMITNIGKGPVDLKAVGVTGTIELPNKQFVGNGCGGAVYTLAAPKSLDPGKSYSSSFTCNKSLASGKQYVYILTLNTNGGYVINESNTANNSSSFQFTKP